MSGLENIIDQINEEAEKEKNQILEEAEKDAKKKKSKAREKAESEKERLIEKGKREAEGIKRRILANARKKARQNKLEAREEVIQEVLKDSRKELSNMRNSEEYEKVLKNLIVSGGIAIGGGDLEASVLRNDKKIISDDEVKEMAKEISEETGKDTSLEILANLQNANGGTIVRKTDESVVCDNTFGARLERMKSSLRSEIANILFED